MDRGAWWATVHGVAKSWAQLSDLTYLLTYLLREMYDSMKGLVKDTTVSKSS